MTRCSYIHNYILSRSPGATSLNLSMYLCFLNLSHSAYRWLAFFFCTGLPLARTRWVRTTFSSHCTLSSNQYSWLTSATAIIISSENSLGMLGIKPRLLGEKQVCCTSMLLGSFKNDGLMGSELSRIAFEGEATETKPVDQVQHQTGFRRWRHRRLQADDGASTPAALLEDQALEGAQVLQVVLVAVRGPVGSRLWRSSPW